MTVGFSRAGWVVVWHDDTRSWILTPLGTRLLSWQLLLSVAGDDEKCFSSFKSFSAVDKNIDNLHSYLKPSGLYLVCGSQWLYAFKYNPDICKRFNDDYSDYQDRKLKLKKTNLTTLKLILKNHKTSLPRLTTIHLHSYGYDPQFHALVTITMISFGPRPRRSVRCCCAVDGPKHEPVKHTV